MAESRVRLPRGVSPPFTVFLNGVRQEEGADYRVAGGELVFDRELVQEGKLGAWRWFCGAWGIGTYRKRRPGRRAPGTPAGARASPTSSTW